MTHDEKSCLLLRGFKCSKCIHLVKRTLAQKCFIQKKTSIIIHNLRIIKLYKYVYLKCVYSMQSK